jgi:LuxR family maltose regulon positive regulatory protein
VAQADKREGQAQLWMQEALRLGHRYGLMRSLLDAHPDAAEHVRELSARIPLDPVLQFYVTRLLATPHSVDATPSPASGGTAEPLTQREADVLRMLALALPNKKIARTLGLSIETVKWHLRNVYRKLDVAGRDDAVARARDLGLVHEPVIPSGLNPTPSSRGG